MPTRPAPVTRHCRRHRHRHRHRTLRVTLLPLVLSAAACGDSPTPSAGAPAEDLVARLEAQVPGWMDGLGIPGASLALIVEGRPVWLRAFGSADPAGGRPMELDAVYRVESLSKPVTAWGVMTLVEDGRLGLDDPVESRLSGFRLPPTGFNPEGVTVRRLLSHSAGLPLGTLGVEFTPGEPMPSLEAMLDREARAVAPPGSGFTYSNPGFNLLELLVQQTTGEDFSGYMARRVLGPLGMHDAHFGWDPAVEDRLPVGHDLRGRPVPAYTYPERGAGGLFATLEDMSRFVVAGMPRWDPAPWAVLSVDAIEELQVLEVRGLGVYGLVADGYGLGHFVELLSDERRAVFHGGQGNGWMTHMHWVPETGDGIIILTNSQRSWPFMARVLGDWAEWRGLSPVGMARIHQAGVLLGGLVALLLVAALAQALRLALDLRRGIRRVAPFSAGRRLRAGQCLLRSVQLGVALGLVALVAWAAKMDYLFLASVFPHRMGGLAAALLALALVLTATALLPRAGHPSPPAPPLPPSP
ncbi:MAG: class A beta-lactamase-related serine hydrolase [Gemmatimonadales bacterium]|nr:MAG: class A beta-lactamase-related serine hydrolase [Gemmatimonadales bacterium]